MALFTVTNGEANNLAVVKVSPKEFNCFTSYEYIVTANQGDSITINITGNDFESKYINNNTEISFSNNVTFNYDTSLSISFLLLNSGVTGIFSNATIRIDNNTTSAFYENFVQRENDDSNCYDNAEYLLRTGDTMQGTLNMAENDLNTNSYLEFRSTSNPNNRMRLQNFATQDFFMIPAGSNSNSDGVLGYDFLTNKWSIGNNEIITEENVINEASLISFTPYLTINSTNVQDSIEELKDEVNLLSESNSGNSGINLIGATSGNYTIGNQSWQWSKTGRIAIFNILLNNINGSSGSGFLRVDYSGTDIPPFSAINYYNVITSGIGVNFYSITARNVGGNQLEFLIQTSLDDSNFEAASNAIFTGTEFINITGSYQTLS